MGAGLVLVTAWLHMCCLGVVGRLSLGNAGRHVLHSDGVPSLAGCEGAEAFQHLASKPGTSSSTLAIAAAPASMFMHHFHVHASTTRLHNRHLTTAASAASTQLGIIVQPHAAEPAAALQSVRTFLHPAAALLQRPQLLCAPRQGLLKGSLLSRACHVVGLEQHPVSDQLRPAAGGMVMASAGAYL